MTFRKPSRRAICASALLASMTFSFEASAEVTSPVLAINADAATAEVTVQTLRGNISVLMGSGGNITVLAGTDGKLMVDAGIAVSKDRVQAALDSVSPAPVKYLINTHWHWDHTDGNPWVHDAGATVVAHENTLKHLTVQTRVIEWGYTFPPLPSGGLPTVTYKKDRTIDFDGESIQLRHFGSGHTDGDTIVYFPKADVLVMGDTWWNGHYPFIDYGAGGSIDGMINWANAGIGIATDHTLIVPGHGDVGTRKQLVAYRDMLVAARSRVAAMKKQGKSLEDVVNAKATAPFDAKWGDFVIDPAFFTQLVYLGV